MMFSTQLFGTPAAGTPLFGAPISQPSVTAKPVQPPFGSLFGASLISQAPSVQPSTNGLFGASLISQAPSVQPSTNGLFGAPATPVPLFGTPVTSATFISSQPLFGAPVTQPFTTPATQALFGSLFGAPPVQSQKDVKQQIPRNLFGTLSSQSPPTFVANTPTTITPLMPLFGTPQPTSAPQIALFGTPQPSIATSALSEMGKQVQRLPNIPRVFEPIKQSSTDSSHKSETSLQPIRSTPVLTKYELAKILARRAEELDSGKEPLVDISEDDDTAMKIAKKEFRMKRLPVIIQRYFPNGSLEEIAIDNLAIPRALMDILNEA